MDLGHPGILAQQIDQGTALKPLTMQAPLTARREQATGNQHKQDSILPCPFTADAQPLRPERIELQLAPHQQRQPARAPLSQLAQLQLRKLTWTIEAPASTSAQRFFAKSDGVRGCVAASSSTSIDAPPCQLLRVFDLTQLQRVPLHHAPPSGPRVLDNAPIAMLLVILPANLQRKNMMAADYRHTGGPENRLGRHYSRFLPL